MAERPAQSEAERGAMRSTHAVADLVVDALHVAIDGTPVLHDVCFRIPSGSLAAIVGPSGSGKSTILRAVAGLQPATSGHIRLGEHELTDVGGSRTLTVRPEHRGVGWVPQASSLFPHMTVAEHVDFGALPRAGRGRRERAIARDTARPLLALVGIEALADRYPDQLSGGQAQRVALARALAAQPAALLLDEPFSALDPSLRKDLRDEVRALLHRLGVTALLVTHDQDEALATADSILVINEGRVRQHAAPSIVYRRPASRWVAAFIGEANFLGAAIVEGRASTPLGEISVDTVGSASASDAGAGAVMVRPEQIVIDHAGVPAFVERVRYGGHDALVSLVMASSGNGQVRVIARWAASIVPKEGETIAISIAGAGLLLPD